MIKQDISENLVNVIYLGIGSNLGNRIINIEKAKSLLLENNIKIIATSSYYETPSWPDPKNPKFINIVLKARCKNSPYELLKVCKFIELKLGRKRSPVNSPRICDIDIIDFKKIILSNNPTVPHKMMHKRNFVLFPLFEIEKQWFHPVKRINIQKLIFSLPENEIRSIKRI